MQAFYRFNSLIVRRFEQLFEGAMYLLFIIYVQCAWLAQLVKAPTQVYVHACMFEGIQLHLQADSLTSASILPKSIK
jgi:hypothetical protein